VTSATRLSALQRTILVALLQGEANGEAVHGWGVPWGGADGGKSASAAASRALRRLEQRGLLHRRNYFTGDKYSDAEDQRFVRPQVRTTHVALTPEGRAVAGATCRPGRQPTRKGPVLTARV
jgi:hypothetical protein